MMKTREITNEELKKIQCIELEILDEFDRICRKHNLKYCLAGGTCIGAIRHNGFIPWDDDIDVHMPREDYDKLIKIQKKELNKKKFYFQSLELNDDFGWPFAKIRRKNTIYKEELMSTPDNKSGVWIDIFPLDKIPDKKSTIIITYIKMFYYKIMLFRKLKNNTKGNTFLKNIILKILFFLSHFYSLKTLKKKLYKTMTKYNYLKTNYKNVNYGGSYFFKEVIDKKYIQNLTEHKFENKKYYITKYYDEYLTYVYGDYMKLPPKEQQEAKHKVSKIKLLDD